MDEYFCADGADEDVWLQEGGVGGELMEEVW